MNDNEFQAFVKGALTANEFLVSVTTEYQLTEAVNAIFRDMGDIAGVILRYSQSKLPLYVDEITDAMARLEFHLAWLRNILADKAGPTREEVIQKAVEFYSAIFPQGGPC